MPYTLVIDDELPADPVAAHPGLKLIGWGPGDCFAIERDAMAILTASANDPELPQDVRDRALAAIDAIKQASGRG